VKKRAGAVKKRRVKRAVERKLEQLLGGLSEEERARVVDAVEILSPSLPALDQMFIDPMGSDQNDGSSINHALRTYAEAMRRLEHGGMGVTSPTGMITVNFSEDLP